MHPKTEFYNLSGSINAYKSEKCRSIDITAYYSAWTLYNLKEKVDKKEKVV